MEKIKTTESIFINGLLSAAKRSARNNRVWAIMWAALTGVEYGILLACAGEKWKIAVIAICLVAGATVAARYAREWVRDVKNINRFKKMIANYESEASDTHAEN